MEEKNIITALVILAMGLVVFIRWYNHRPPEHRLSRMGKAVLACLLDKGGTLVYRKDLYKTFGEAEHPREARAEVDRAVVELVAARLCRVEPDEVDQEHYKTVEDKSRFDIIILTVHARRRLAA